MKFIIYKHTNCITNKSYIGYTSSTITKRFNKHIQDAKRGSNYYFHRAIRKYGETCWVSEILCETSSLKTAHRLEIEMIEKHNTFGRRGYNMTSGGGGTVGRIVSNEAKQKSREWHLKFKHSISSKQLMKEKFTALRGKAINQYSKEGRYITTFRSAAEAAVAVGNRNLSGAIHQLCAGTFKHWKQSTVKGFQWKFYTGTTDDIPAAINLRQLSAQRRSAQARAVIQLTLDNQIVQIHTSAKNAVGTTGVYLSGIQRCCNKKLNTAGGYKWEWLSTNPISE